MIDRGRHIHRPGRGRSSGKGMAGLSDQFSAVFRHFTGRPVVFDCDEHGQGQVEPPAFGVSESFAAFFPVSFVLFLLLFLGRDHVFPWLGMNLHGKEVWLNLPFLFSRDFIGISILYGLGVRLSLPCAVVQDAHMTAGRTGLSGLLGRRWQRQPAGFRKISQADDGLRQSLYSGFRPGAVPDRI